jgi:hypothetical protein
MIPFKYFFLKLYQTIAVSFKFLIKYMISKFDDVHKLPIIITDYNSERQAFVKELNIFYYSTFSLLKFINLLTSLLQIFNFISPLANLSPFLRGKSAII